MDFELTEEQQLIRDTARDFATNQVAPTAAARDKEHRFPLAEFKAAAELGFAGMLVPEEYGGSGLGTLGQAIVVEEISRACASTGVTISVHNGLVTGPVVRFGTEDQKRQYLPKLASGEWLGAYALSEAGAGSDAAALACKATRDGDGWVLDGPKLWITSGNEAQLIIVFARAEQGVTAFLVETDVPGLSVGKVEEKLGIRSSSTVEINLDGVRIPGDRVLGEVGKGLTVAFNTLDGGRIGIAAQSVGAIPVPVYQDAVAEEMAYVLNGDDPAYVNLPPWVNDDETYSVEGNRLGHEIGEYVVGNALRAASE